MADQLGSSLVVLLLQLGKLAGGWTDELKNYIEDS